MWHRPARLTVDAERVTALRRAAGATVANPAAPLLYSRMALLVSPESTPSMMGVSPSSLRHAGHQWDLQAPLEIGGNYEFTDWDMTSDETRRARDGGRLRFAVFTRRWSEDGRLVQTERMTVVHTPVQQSGEGEPMVSSWPADVPGPAVRIVVDHDWDTEAGQPGELVTEIDAGWVDRAAIASFGVLIGDLTPIHHDVAAARAAGLPDVIAMGTMSAAMTLAVAEDRVGPERIRRCALRFHRPVLPGAPLRLLAFSQPPTPAGAEFRLELHAAGQLALSADLQVRGR